MKHNIQKISVIFIILILVNIAVFTSTQSADYYKNQQPLQQNLEEGTKFMPYCDGGFSDTIISETEEGCLADYPGSLARNVVPFGSVIILLVSSLFIFMRKKK